MDWLGKLWDVGKSFLPSIGQNLGNVIGGLFGGGGGQKVAQPAQAKSPMGFGSQLMQDVGQNIQGPQT